MSSSSQTSYFKTVLEFGCIFLEKARFKPSSLSTTANFGENTRTISGTALPTLNQIKDYTDGQYKMFSDCIAFSINPDKSINFKYQLFPEDIELIPFQVTDKSIGVYIRNLDDFSKLVPKYGYIGYDMYGTSVPAYNQGSNRKFNCDVLTEEQRLKVYDGCWTVLNWRLTTNGTDKGGIVVPNPTKDNGCTDKGVTMAPVMGTSNVTTLPGQQRVVVKPRRVGSNQYELFATADNNLANIWYYIMRKTLFANRYWAVVNWISQQNYSSTNNSLYIPNRNPTKTPQSTIYGSEGNYAPQTLGWDQTSVCIKVDGVKVGGDCNICIVSTDTYGNLCYSDNGNGVYFSIIQPSWLHIMDTVMKNNNYNVQKNFCIVYRLYTNSYYIPSYSFTNEYLSNYFQIPGQLCENIETSFCREKDVTGTSNLYGADCQNICKRWNCSQIIDEYCTTLGENALNKDSNVAVCGCATARVPFVKNAYNNYVSFMRNKGFEYKDCPFPENIYPPCMTANYKLYGDSTTNPIPECKASGINCVTSIEFNNSGSITGNINTNVSNDCKSFINTITSGTVDCKSDSDCITVQGNPYCINSKCVQCRDSKECSSPTFCNTAQNKCQECLSNSDCEDVTKPFCDSIGTCKECINNEDCTDGKICQNGICRVECNDDEDCKLGNKCIDNICKEEKTKISSSSILAGVGFLVLILFAIIVIRRRRR